MNDLLGSLDAMLESITNESQYGDPQSQTINKLVKAARSLLDLADEISQGRLNLNELTTSFGSQPTSLDMPKLGIRRLQEMHVSPVIGKRISRTLYKIRRARDTIFQEPDMFGEPAWDILLDLFISEREDRSVSVTSACMAACVPATTALRWIAVLEAKGYVERTPDCLDARRHYVGLTDMARVMLNKFYADIVRRELI